MEAHGSLPRGPRRRLGTAKGRRKGQARNPGREGGRRRSEAEVARPEGGSEGVPGQESWG